MAKKCVVCGKWIPEEEMGGCVPYKNNRIAHKSCFNQAMKIIKTDKDEQLEKKKESKEKNSRGRKKTEKIPKAELKEGLSDEEYREKRDYYDYIKQLLGVDKLTAKIYTISERDKERFDWTWRGMKDTLVYLHDIKEKVLSGDIVGIVSYYYDEAQAFYEDVKKVEENNKNAALSDMYQTKQIIYYKKPKNVVEDLVIESIKKTV